MSLLETQRFLARLYTEREVREAFFSDPQMIGGKAGLSENEINDLLMVVAEELNRFAESLFYKRLREAEKLLPVTRRILGTDFEILFREFAAGSQPETIRKHLEDAVNFADFLQSKDFDEPWTKDLTRFEQANLKFRAFDKQFLICKFDYPVAQIFREITSEDQSHRLKKIAKKRTYAVWLKLRGKIRHFIW